MKSVGDTGNMGGEGPRNISLYLTKTLANDEF